MIIKIIINNLNDNIKIIIDFFRSQDLEIMFFGNSLYVYDLEEINIKHIQQELLQLTGEEYYCQKIDEENLLYEKQQVINWCREKFIERDTQKFEKNRQAELKAMQEFIADIEKELNKACQAQQESN